MYVQFGGTLVDVLKGSASWMGKAAKLCRVDTSLVVIETTKELYTAAVFVCIKIDLPTES